MGRIVLLPLALDFSWPNKLDSAYVAAAAALVQVLSPRGMTVPELIVTENHLSYR